MVRFFVLIIFLWLSITVNAQQNVDSRLEYCNREIVELEQKVKKLNELLQIQTKEINDLKVKQVEQKDKINELTNDNHDLHLISVSLLHLGLKFEEQGDYKAALEIYKLLIKSYPKSLEAAASSIKINDLQKAKK